jgi:CO/xanthine dehydrogenase Mo-binding subunit
VYDSGDYETTLRKARDIVGYDELRREQSEKRKRSELLGIGVGFFTEAVGAGLRLVPGDGGADPGESVDGVSSSTIRASAAGRWRSSSSRSYRH